MMGLLFYLLTPETLDIRSHHSDRRINSSATVSTSPTLSAYASSKPPLMTKLRSAVSFLTRDWRVPILILPFAMHMLVGNSSQLVIQYISKRYGLTLAKSTFLMTIRNAVNCALMFFILPYMSTMVMSMYALSSLRKDLYLARVSQLLVAIGWTCVAFSPNIWMVTCGLGIASLGSASLLLLRSFIASLVSSHEVARVNSIMAIVDSIGLIVGNPLLARLFKTGLSLGGVWVGLPFFFVGIISTLAAVVFILVQLRNGEGEDDVTDGEEDVLLAGDS